MEDVVQRLEKIIKDADATPLDSLRDKWTPGVSNKSKVGVQNPWAAGSKIATAFETFASRLSDAESQEKLEELSKEVGTLLGARAIDTVSGVFNIARLYRILCSKAMDIADAKAAVVLYFNTRAEHKMDAKRKHIVSENLSFDTIPRSAEYQKYVPNNPFVCRAKDGQIINYYCFGAGANFDGLRNAFTIEEYVDFMMFMIELNLLMVDALSAIEARDIPDVTFYDMSGGSLAKLFDMLSYLQLATASIRNTSGQSQSPGSIAVSF